MFEAILLLLPIPFILLYGSGPVTNLITLVLLILCLPGFFVMRGGAPFVATPRSTLLRMLKLASIKPGETVIDAGCGDGRMLVAATKQGAIAVGFERSLPTYLVAKFRSIQHKNMHVFFRDLWKQDYSKADVVFCYLLTDTMRKFEQKIWPTLKPGARVVSHAFSFKHIEPDAKENGALLYIKK